MTRLELFQRLCDLNDDLQRVTRTVEQVPQRYALDGIVGRIDELIDGCVRGGMEPLSDEDDTPCPHCGEEDCEASCTGAILADEQDCEETP